MQLEYRGTLKSSFPPQRSERLRDKYRAVYFNMYYTGMIVILPWNIIITVNSFWNYKFRDLQSQKRINGLTNSTRPYDESETLTDLQKDITSYLSIAANVTTAVITILHAHIGHKYPLWHRIIGSQILNVMLFGVFTILSYVNSDSWREEYLIVVLVILILFNCSNSVTQGALAGNAAWFPKNYMGAFVNGHGLSGVIAALLNLLIVGAIADENGLILGFICFAITEGLIILGLITTSVMTRLPYYEEYCHEPESRGYLSLQEYLDIFKKGGDYLFVNFYSFFITLVIYPALAVLIRPESSDTSGEWESKYFIPVGCFCVFNFLDYFGRHSAAWISWSQSGKLHRVFLVILSLLRTLFIPLFFFSNLSPSKRTTQVLIKSDVIYMVAIGFLAFSNGYLTNTAMMCGPKAVPSDNEKNEVMGSLLITSVVIGIGLGSVVSPLVISLL